MLINSQLPVVPGNNSQSNCLINEAIKYVMGHHRIFVLRAHPVRGESRYQRNTTTEVATVL